MNWSWIVVGVIFLAGFAQVTGRANVAGAIAQIFNFAFRPRSPLPTGSGAQPATMGKKELDSVPIDELLKVLARKLEEETRKQNEDQKIKTMVEAIKQHLVPKS